MNKQHMPLFATHGKRPQIIDAVVAFCNKHGTCHNAPIVVLASCHLQASAIRVALDTADVRVLVEICWDLKHIPQSDLYVIARPLDFDIFALPADSRMFALPLER